MSAGTPPPRLIGPAAVAAVLRRPDLWSSALRLVGALARRGWWRQWPPVPRPDPTYLAWRAQTAYGGDGDAAGADVGADLVSLLCYVKAMRADRGR